MRKISWITADYFIDVDLPIIAELKSYYQIYWQIIIPVNSPINYSNYVHSAIPNQEGVIVDFVQEVYSHKDFRQIKTTISIINRAKHFKPSIFYISGYWYPWGLPLFKLLMPTKKVVVACHNITTPQGASNPLLAKISIRFILLAFKNIQVFSRSQHVALQQLTSNKNVLEAPLALKDYGIPNSKREDRREGIIRFLSFGIIREYKRIDLLIEAACILYDRGYRNFRILIAGNCETWETSYAPLIRYPSIFELDIRRIPNEAIPDIFAKSHYMVLPYQDIAQSGAITVAFNYNVPTIVSNIPQFVDYYQDNITGLSFCSGDVISLADTLQYAIDNHDSIYTSLKQNQALFIQNSFSLDSIVGKYKSYFETI